MYVCVCVCTAETGVLLAKEYVENSVIEEDAAALLKYMQRYVDLEDVVEFGVSQIERFLVENGTPNVALKELLSFARVCLMSLRASCVCMPACMCACLCAPVCACVCLASDCLTILWVLPWLTRLCAPQRKT